MKSIGETFSNEVDRVSKGTLSFHQAIAKARGESLQQSDT